jgi:hypothetical protein
MDKKQITPLFNSPEFSGASTGFAAARLVLEKEECQKLKELLEAETISTDMLAKACLRLDDAKDHARQSQKNRDNFCLGIEKKFGISGKKWSVNFETGEVKVDG